MATDPMDMLIREGIVDPPDSPSCLYRIGPYRVTGVLGEGAMGVVVEATMLSTAQADQAEPHRVALKVLRPKLMDRPALVYQFLAEARRVMAMSHPNIVRVFEVRERDAGPYFVMPVYAGGSLGDRIHAAEKPPDRNDVLKWAMQIARGMACAHSRGLLHRDLKPSNILLDDHGDAVVSDFGLFRSLSDSAAEAGWSKAVGTCAYLSPVAAAGEPEDVRGDIYGFGALLYELLTHRVPYLGDSGDEVLAQIKAGPPKRIQEIAADADAGLCYVAEKAMSRTPAERYGSFSRVIEDMTAIEGGRPVPSRAESQQRPSRRGLALLLASLLALAGGAVWYALAILQGGGPTTLESSPIQFRENTPLYQSRVLEASLPLAEGKDFDIAVSLAGWQQDDALNDSGWHKACPVPWGTEGRSRLAVVEDGEILLVNPDGWGSRVIYDRFRPGYPIDLYAVPTLTGRFETTLAATGLTDQGPCCVLFDDEAEVLHELFVADHIVDVPDFPQAQHRQVWGPTLYDLDQDDKPELLLCVYDGYQPAFRGLICFNLATESKRWECPLPSHLYAPKVIEHQGESIIIVGSYAPANAYRVGAWSDDIGRIWAINAAGQPVWERDVNEMLDARFPQAVLREGEDAKYTRIEVAQADLDGDGAAEVYALIAGNKTHQRGIGLLLQIDPLDGGTSPGIPRHVNGAFLMSVVPNPRQQGDAILITDVFGRVHLIGDGLMELHSAGLLGLELDSASLAWAGSLARAGRSSRAHVFFVRQESLADEADRTPRDFTPNDIESVSGCQLIITDERLEVISRIRLADRLPLGASYDGWVWQSDRGDRIVVQIDDATLLFNVE